MNFIFQFRLVNQTKTASDVGKFHREETGPPYQFILASDLYTGCDGQIVAI